MGNAWKVSKINTVGGLGDGNKRNLVGKGWKERILGQTAGTGRRQFRGGKKLVHLKLSGTY